MRKSLLLSAVLLLLALPSRATDLRITFSVTINGKPVRLIFDTGATSTILLDQSAKRVGLKILPIPKNSAPPAPGQIRAPYTNEATMMTNGSFIRRSFRALDAGADVATKMKADGFLSWRDIAADYILIDASRPGLWAIPTLPDVTQWLRWDISSMDDVLILQRTENGKTIRLGVDTGDPDGVMLNNADWKAWIAAHPGQPRTITSSWCTAGSYDHEIARASRMDFGNLSLRDVPVTIMQPNSEFTYPHCDAVLGLFALSRCQLIIDYKNHVAYTHSIAFLYTDFDYNGIGATFNETSVMKDSPAENAGVQNGDFLIAVDGSAKWRTDPNSDLTALFSRPPGTIVKLLVKRGKTTREFAITLRELGETAWQPIPNEYETKGNTAYDDDRHDDAIAAFTKLIAFDPENPRGYFLRGRARLEKPDYDGAIADLTEAIDRKAGNTAECLRARGLAYAGKKENDKAIADYTEAIRLIPDYADVYFHRGYLHDVMSRANDALADYTACLAIDPGYSGGYYNRSIIKLYNGDADAALADANMAAYLNAQDPDTITNRGLIYDSLGNWSAALADYLKAIHLDEASGNPAPEADAFLDAAWLLATCPDASMRDSRKAVEFAARGGALDEWQSAHSWSVMAAAFAAAGKFDQAIKFEIKCAEHADPAGNDITLSHERLATYRNNKPWIIPSQQILSLSNKAWFETQREDYQNALATYGKIIELDPASSDGFNSRGYVYSVMGDYEKSIADQKKTLELDPDYYAPYNSLAWLYATCPDAHFRDGKQAVEYAKKAVDLTARKNPSELDTLAAAYAEAGDFPQAIKWENDYIASPDLPAEKIESGKKRLALYQESKPYREELKK